MAGPIHWIAALERIAQELDAGLSYALLHSGYLARVHEPAVLEGVAMLNRAAVYLDTAGDEVADAVHAANLRMVAEGYRRGTVNARADKTSDPRGVLHLEHDLAVLEAIAAHLTDRAVC